MGLLPEKRPLTGAEAGMIIALAALMVFCCLGVAVTSMFAG